MKRSIIHIDQFSMYIIENFKKIKFYREIVVTSRNEEKHANKHFTCIMF